MIEKIYISRQVQLTNKESIINSFEDHGHLRNIDDKITHIKDSLSKARRFTQSNKIRADQLPSILEAYGIAMKNLKQEN